MYRNYFILGGRREGRIRPQPLGAFHGGFTSTRIVVEDRNNWLSVGHQHDWLIVVCIGLHHLQRAFVCPVFLAAEGIFIHCTDAVLLAMKRWNLET